MLILIAAELNSEGEKCSFPSICLQNRFGTKKVGRLNPSRPKVAPAGLGEKNGSGIPNCFRCQTFHLASEPGLSHHGCPSHPSHLSHPSHASHSSHPSHPSHTSHSSYPSHSGHPCHLSHPSHPIVLVVQVIPVILVTLARRMQIFHQ